MLFAGLIHNKRNFLFSTVHLMQPIKLPRNHVWNIQYIIRCQQIVFLLFPNNHQTMYEVHVVIFDMGWDEKKRAARKLDLGAARLIFKKL